MFSHWVGHIQPATSKVINLVTCFPKHHSHYNNFKIHIHPTHVQVMLQRLNILQEAINKQFDVKGCADKPKIALQFSSRLGI